VKIVPNHNNGWKQAAQVAIDEAKKTIHGIHGLEITDMTAKLDPNTGKITEYRTGIKISFAVEHESR
jgi:flavin-binding protein dodecin